MYAIPINPPKLAELLNTGFFAPERDKNAQEMERLSKLGIGPGSVSAMVDMMVEGLTLDNHYWVAFHFDGVKLYGAGVDDVSRSHALECAHVNAWDIHKPLSRYDKHGPEWQDKNNYFVIQIQ